MTLPSERYNAINLAREFLRSLLDHRQTKRIPKLIRLRARSVLKHFIWETDLEQIARCKKCGKILENAYNWRRND